MKFRKSICIFAAAVMAASMLTACGGDDKGLRRRR
ncbi:unknown [Ruminococcus sp. CAG:579]|nr:unknown [Ruminococcus sp. CAG:579]